MIIIINCDIFSDNENVPIDFVVVYLQGIVKEECGISAAQQFVLVFDYGDILTMILSFRNHCLRHRFHLICREDRMCLPRHKCCCEPTREPQSTPVGVEDGNR